MIEKMIAGLVPVLLKKVEAVPYNDRLLFATFIVDLAFAYINNEPVEFDALLAKTDYPPEWKTAIKAALWHGSNNQV